jgi:PIN domain nuclease of toxin-antitoxin system
MKEDAVVLAACALIAFFNDEAGADVVAEAFESVPEVVVAAVNVLEVAYDAVRTTGNPAAAMEVMDAVGRLPCVIRWVMDAAVLAEAARFKVQFRISLADAVALGTAKVSDVPLVTSDHHEFDDLEEAGGMRFVWIR